MRLSQISDRTLDYYDLSRAEARREARAGQLWATPDRQRVAVAPTGAAALWMLGVERVQQVRCSTQPEGVLWDLREAVRLERQRRRRWQRDYGSTSGPS